LSKAHLVAVGLTFFAGMALILAFPILTHFGEEYVAMEGPFVEATPGFENPQDKGKLRFCVATMWSPRETFSRYRRLGERLGHLMGAGQTLVIRSSYRETREALKEGKVDVAIVCTGTLVNMAGEGSCEILVVPRFLDGLEYRGDIIVSTDSPVKDLPGLKGGTVAMTDPESFTGCIIPTMRLRRASSDPGTFLKRAVFMGSHDRAVQAVTSGLVDAAAVDELVYRALCKENPEIKEHTRILWRSNPYGPPPVMVFRGLPEALKERLRSVFLSLHEDEAGLALLRSLGIERFVLPEKGAYDTALDLFRKFRAAGGCPWF